MFTFTEEIFLLINFILIWSKLKNFIFLCSDIYIKKHYFWWKLHSSILSRHYIFLSSLVFRPIFMLLVFLNFSQTVKIWIYFWFSCFRSSHRRCVHFILWKYSTSWKYSLYFVYIFRMCWNFLIKFCSSDPSFDRNILRFLYLKFKTSAHAHITIAYYYALFTNFLRWYEFLKLLLVYILNKRSWSMVLLTWSCDFSKNIF